MSKTALIFQILPQNYFLLCFAKILLNFSLKYRFPKILSKFFIGTVRQYLAKKFILSKNL